MRFINSKKPESSFSSALSSSAPVVLLPQLSAEEDDISNFYMNDVEMPMQTSDSKKVQARRGTLSPGTARAMIIEAMEEQVNISYIHIYISLYIYIYYISCTHSLSLFISLSQSLSFLTLPIPSSIINLANSGTRNGRYDDSDRDHEQ